MSTKSQQLQIRVTPEQKVSLKRLARRAGQDVSAFVLSRALPAAHLRFGDLLQDLRNEGDRRFVLAELNDFLVGLAPVEFPDAVGEADLRDLSPFLQNYLAAMVEQAAQQKGDEPPDWVQDVEPLEEPYFATPLSSLRLHLLGAAPVPFKRRAIFVDSGVGDRV